MDAEKENTIISKIKKKDLTATDKNIKALEKEGINLDV